MAIEGPQNFDDERAHNYLFTLTQQLEQEIEDYFLKREQNGFEPDDLAHCHGELMPCLDILITLSNHYDTPISLDRTQFTYWQKIFLQFWDEWHKGYTDWYVVERRQVIERTFLQVLDLLLD